jgi:hypothetical protein
MSTKDSKGLNLLLRATLISMGSLRELAKKSHRSQNCLQIPNSRSVGQGGTPPTGTSQIKKEDSNLRMIRNASTSMTQVKITKIALPALKKPPMKINCQLKSKRQRRNATLIILHLRKIRRPSARKK